MDGSRFDNLTRALVASRRGALRTLLSAAAAALAAAVTGVSAQDDERRNPFYRAGLPCDAGQRCGRLAPCEFGLCTPKACRIDGATRQDLSEKPGEPCQFCAATLTTWTEWSALTDGTECESSDEDPCREPSGICIQGECARNPLSDNECGPDKVCCDGDCCDPLEICVDFDCTPGCVIDGTNYRAFVGNPESPLCQFCYPDRDRTAWTILPDGPNELCEECCQGVCCEPGTACGAVGCVPGCRIHFSGIESRWYIDGEHNLDNPCQFCSLSVSDSSWSPDDSQRCGSDSNQFCCNGECCPPGQCCDRGLACSAAECCVIENVPYPADEHHPDTELCKSCKPDTSTDDWTDLPDDATCGAGGTRVCCNGFCCPQDQCCDSETGFCGRCECEGEEGSAGIRASLLASCAVCCDGLCCGPEECCGEEGDCEPCGCEIGGVGYADGAVNPDSPCQVCDSSRRADFWSPGPDNVACGDSLDQVCCNSICCGPDNCCQFGRCEPCGCTIDSEYYLAGEKNPANECEECVPGAITYEWSPVFNETPCGESGDQICCQGACCADGECCNSGCRSCHCEIDGQEYDDGEQNPANECERCSTYSDPFAWTPEFDHSLCGPNRDQSCCGGVCCPRGECCTEAGVCERCHCTIEGQDYDDGTVNPANACEVCDHWASNTAWTLADDGSSCGPNLDQVCCAGACCPSGECCHASTGSCGPGPCHCTLDDLEYDDGAANPDNECEFCDSTLSASSWSPRANGTFCGSDEFRVCCNGACCSPDVCCFPDGTCGNEDCEPEGCSIDGVEYPNFAKNPENDCQECDSRESRTSWSSMSIGICGPNQEQFCAGGVCCELGVCPDLSQDVCGDYCSNVCAIGGVLYYGTDYNPGNECEWCSPSASHTSWTIKSPNSYCNGSWDRVCCFGTCCDTDHYCSTFHGNICVHEDTPCC